MGHVWTLYTHESRPVLSRFHLTFLPKRVAVNFSLVLYYPISSLCQISAIVPWAVDGWLVEFAFMPISFECSTKYHCAGIVRGHPTMNSPASVATFIAVAAALGRYFRVHILRII